MKFLVVLLAAFSLTGCNILFPNTDINVGALGKDQARILSVEESSIKLETNFNLDTSGDIPAELRSEEVAPIPVTINSSSNILDIKPTSHKTPLTIGILYRLFIKNANGSDVPVASFSLSLPDGSVVTSKLATGPANSVLKTDGSGLPFWDSSISGATSFTPPLASNSGTISISPGSNGNSLMYRSPGQWQPDFVRTSDLKLNSGANFAPTTACPTGQFITWDPVTDGMHCREVKAAEVDGIAVVAISGNYYDLVGRPNVAMSDVSNNVFVSGMTGPSAGQSRSIKIGNLAQATGDGAIAIGSSAQVFAGGSVAIGDGSTSFIEKSVTVGGAIIISSKEIVITDSIYSRNSIFECKGMFIQQGGSSFMTGDIKLTFQTDNSSFPTILHQVKTQNYEGEPLLSPSFSVVGGKIIQSVGSPISAARFDCVQFRSP